MLKGRLDIDLRATCNAYVQIRKVETNQFIDKLKDLFPGRWNARVVGALVESVQNDVSRTLRRESEHCFETFCHSVVTGLLNTTVMVRIEAGKCIATRIRASRKLNEERRENVAKSLLIGVSEVEIEICNGGISGVAQLHDILDDCGAG